MSEHNDYLRAEILRLHRSALSKVRDGLIPTRIEVLAIAYAMATVEAFNDIVVERYSGLGALQTEVLDRADITMDKLMLMTSGSNG